MAQYIFLVIWQQGLSITRRARILRMVWLPITYTDEQQRFTGGVMKFNEILLLAQCLESFESGIGDSL